jgi:hypothetical protein
MVVCWRGKIGTFSLELRLYVERAISREEFFAITRMASKKVDALKLERYRFRDLTRAEYSHP